MEKKFTPGPWQWELNAKHREIKLCGGVPRYDLYVMDFVRWGMNGAQPQFLNPVRRELMLLEKSETFAVPDPNRKHHADWFQLINHPDAKLIECAPEMFEALEKIMKHFPQDVIDDQMGEDTINIKKLLTKATTI